MSDSELFADRMRSPGLVRLSEAAAITAAQMIGRDDEKSVGVDAVDALRTLLVIAGAGVISEGERDEAPMPCIGEQVGMGNRPGVDIGLDPLEGTNLTANDMSNALTVTALGSRGSMLHVPEDCMEMVAVGPAYAPGRVHVALPAADVLAAEATSAGVLNFSAISPLEDEAVLGTAETGAIVTFEAASVRGGPSGASAEFLATHHPAPMKIMGFPGFLPTGLAACLFDHFGLTAQGVAASGRRALAREAQ